MFLLKTVEILTFLPISETKVVGNVKITLPTLTIILLYYYIIKHHQRNCIEKIFDLTKIILVLDILNSAMPHLATKEKMKSCTRKHNFNSREVR